MTDISSIKTGERTIEILHPGTREKLGIRVKIVHVDDDRLIALKRKVTDERQHLEARGKFFKAEHLEENTKRLINTAVVGWEWYNPTGGPGDVGYDIDKQPDWKGDTNPEYNRKNITAMIDELPWFKDQVSEPIGDLASFFDASPAS